MVKLTELAEALPATVPFVGPEAQERASGRGFAARLGANECGFGPSPKAVEAMVGVARDMWMYGDPENHDLREALAAHHSISRDHIAIGEGIDGLLGTLVRLLIAAGDVAVTSDGAYPTFDYHVTGCGGRLEKVPYRDDSEDLQALIARAQEVGAKVIYFANPDNPMGSVCPGAEIEAALTHLPQDCLLILDEAYVELAPDGSAPRVDPADPRVIRLRTFSKAYGLAGLRVGYAMGDATPISAFDKLRNHFGVSRMAQAAAVAALQDEDWLAHILSETAKARATIAEIAVQNGLSALPSATNFLTIDCGRDGSFARHVLAGLLEAGVFARMPGVAPLDRAIRISCAPEAELEVFARVLPKALIRARTEI